VTKLAFPPSHVGCPYCGLHSTAMNHGSVGECVDALQREVARLKDHLRQGKSVRPVGSQLPSAREHAAASPRLARFG
jgi:coproporphyrinogen III oxidase-like Fe-S oxidoreductase